MDDFDEKWYLSTYADVAAAVARGSFASGFAHYKAFGKFEGRRSAPLPVWKFQAHPPQRYMDNRMRYINRGGLVRLDVDVQLFTRGNVNEADMARFYFFCLAFDQIVKKSIPGDMAELGVWKGSTAAVIANFARQLGRTVFLLDTFEGFNPADLQGVDAKQKVQFRDTSLDAVRAVVGEDSVRYIDGYFPDTACRIPSETTFSLVHIDCDLYRPVKSGLEFFYPRLAPGGFLVIHDYSSLHWDGAEQAVDEFFADKHEMIIPLTDSAGSAVIRKMKV